MTTNNISQLASWTNCVRNSKRIQKRLDKFLTKSQKTELEPFITKNIYARTNGSFQSAITKQDKDLRLFF